MKTVKNEILENFVRQITTSDPEAAIESLLEDSSKWFNLSIMCAEFLSFCANSTVFRQSAIDLLSMLIFISATPEEYSHKNRLLALTKRLETIFSVSEKELDFSLQFSVLQYLLSNIALFETKKNPIATVLGTILSFDRKFNVFDIVRLVALTHYAYLKTGVLVMENMQEDLEGLNHNISKWLEKLENTVEKIIETEFSAPLDTSLFYGSSVPSLLLFVSNCFVLMACGKDGRDKFFSQMNSVFFGWANLTVFFDSIVLGYVNSNLEDYRKFALCFLENFPEVEALVNKTKTEDN